MLRRMIIRFLTPPVRRSVAVVITVALLTAVGAFTAFASLNPRDFRSFYLAAAALRHGLDPHDLATLQSLDHGAPAYPYLYSPILALLCAPLTAFDILTAYRVWTVGSIGAFAVAAALAVARGSVATMRIGRLGTTVCILAVLVAAGALDVRSSVHMGQVNTFVIVPLTASIILARRRPYAAGVCLALAGLIKTSPFVLLVLFAAQRRWKAVGATLVTTIAGIVLTLPVIGTRPWTRFFGLLDRMSHLVPIEGLFAFNAAPNFSFIGMSSRMTSDVASARLIGIVMTVLMTVPVVMVSVRGKKHDAKGVLLATLVLMLLASPLTYVHHVIFLFPAVVWLLLDAIRRNHVVYAVSLLVATTTASFDFPLIAMQAGTTRHSLINFGALVTLYVLGVGWSPLRARWSARKDM